MRKAAPRFVIKFRRISGAFFFCATLLVALPAMLGAAAAYAQSLDREALQKMLPPGLYAGELDPLLPVRPVFERKGSENILRGYTFETVNFEPARGYSGKPINMLVTLASDGTFLGVRLISHREPIFLSERGNNLLVEFARQYEGITYRHNTQIVGAKEPAQRNADTANLTGVTQGTVSARAIDRGIIQASIVVAQARIEADQKATSSRQTVDERFEPMGWDQLVSEQWIRTLRVSPEQLEARFAGTPAGKSAGAGTELLPAIELSLVPLSSAQAGRNLLDDKGWAYVRSVTERGQQVWLAIERGSLRVSDAERARLQPGATVGARLRLLLLQGAQTYELREIDFDHSVKLPPEFTAPHPPAKVRLFRTIDANTPDLREAMSINLSTERRYGADALQRVRADWTLTFPQRKPRADNPWWPAWQARSTQLIILAVALAVLSVMLARPRWLAANARRLQVFRIAYLLFTLGFIGWYAQAQLSIVNIVASIEALRRTEDLSFLLFDPLTVCLWGFVLLSLFAWGRGTFCGWLCPFGALQELLSLVSRSLGIKSIRFTQALDSRLKLIKHGVLLFIIGSAVGLASWTDTAVEIEPFKTAINMGFERSWPYVAWAAACALASVVVFRGYCRYLCPLGAALAVLGRVRVLNWIPRRAECGTPCQSCRHRCEYQAIKPSGKVDYDECFQCQDCVTLYQDTKRCLPLVRMHRPARQALAPNIPADA